MNVKLKDGIKIIYVDSSLYCDDVQKFREIMNSSIDKNDRKVLLNISKMYSINSRIMGEIFELYSSMRSNGGELIISDASNDISELFRMTKVDKIVRIFRNEEDGIVYFKEAVLH